KIHRVLCLWRVSCLAALKIAFDAGTRRMEDVASILGTATVYPAFREAAPTGDPFFNINRPDDIAVAENWLKGYPMRPPVIGIVGWKNSGKTTLIESLLRDLNGRGLRVSTLKHAHHAFDIDHPGKDSFRHREAGAHEVLVTSESRWALLHELRSE